MSCMIHKSLLVHLPAHTQELLVLVARWADAIEKIPGKHARWRFTFNEGISEWVTTVTIAQHDLTPLAILSMLDTVGSPSFQAMVDAAQPEILALLLGGVCDASGTVDH